MNMHENEEHNVSPNSVPLLSNHVKEENITIVDKIQRSSFRKSVSKVWEEVVEVSRVAVPLIIAGLLVYGKQAISMVFMGRVGKSAMAGGTLAMGVANITGYSLISGLAAGMEPISSQAHGAARWRLMGLTLVRTTAILLIASILISLLWLTAAAAFFHSWCPASPAAAASAAEFLAASVPSLLLQALAGPLRVFLRSQNSTRPLMLSAVAALAAHAPVNFYLSGGGVRAVAFSGGVTDLIAVGVLGAWVWGSGEWRRSWPGMSGEWVRGWMPILRMGVPSCASVCLEWWWYELIVLFSALLSGAEEAVACMGILMQATGLVYQFPYALGQAASTRVGNELGAGRQEKARTASLVALFLGLLTGLASAGFAAGARFRWGGFFTADAGVAALAAAVLPVAGLCEIGNCPQTAACGVLRGCGRPTLAACVNLGAFYGVGLPVAAVAAFKMGMGLVGLWVGLLAAQVACAAAMVAVLVKTDWARQAERARQLTRSRSTADVDAIAYGVREDVEPDLA